MALLAVSNAEELDEEAKAKAIALIKSGLGEAELKLAASYTSPIYWRFSSDGEDIMEGGSTFFLNAGRRVFGVTAAHVVTRYFDVVRSQPAVSMIACLVWRGWRPAGVITQGPNPGDDANQQSIAGLEIIRIRPIHFINEDGTLNLGRWEQANFT